MPATPALDRLIAHLDSIDVPVHLVAADDQRAAHTAEWAHANGLTPFDAMTADQLDAAATALLCVAVLVMSGNPTQVALGETTRRVARAGKQVTE